MRILLIEDEKELRESLKKSLEAECFNVDTASDGERGSYLARTNDYDLILLDNMLPKKTGLEVCAEVRSRGKNIPIIMLTVQDEIPTKVSLLNAGADDYVTKPFSFEELSARIRAVLRRPQASLVEILNIKDLEINFNTHLVSRAGREIYLTKKEYELLIYLGRNQGRTVSRGMILEHVWDINADPFSNTLETHMLNLRRKVDSKFPLKLIHTIPGRGYKLDTQK